MDPLEKLKLQEEFTSWLHHPYTERLRDYFKEEKLALSEDAMKIAGIYPINHDRILRTLNQASQLVLLEEKIVQVNFGRQSS